MRLQHVVHTDPPDFHGHAPDVTTQRLGAGGNASLGIPGAGSLNNRSASKRSVRTRRNKRR